MAKPAEKMQKKPQKTPLENGNNPSSQHLSQLYEEDEMGRPWVHQLRRLWRRG